MIESTTGWVCPICKTPKSPYVESCNCGNAKTQESTTTDIFEEADKQAEIDNITSAITALKPALEYHKGAYSALNQMHIPNSTSKVQINIRKRLDSELKHLDVLSKNISDREEKLKQLKKKV
jgi:hypothetical protein